MLSIEFSVCGGSNRVTKRILNDQDYSLMLTKKILAHCHLLNKCQKVKPSKEIIFEK